MIFRTCFISFVILLITTAIAGMISGNHAFYYVSAFALWVLLSLLSLALFIGTKEPKPKCRKNVGVDQTSCPGSEPL